MMCIESDDVQWCRCTIGTVGDEDRKTELLVCMVLGSPYVFCLALSTLFDHITLCVSVYCLKMDLFYGVYAVNLIKNFLLRKLCVNNIIYTPQIYMCPP